MQLLKFKIPGLHGNIIDESHGYKYAEDEDETFEYPPVVLALGQAGGWRLATWSIRIGRA
jgi:hypothetical protein